MSEFRLVDNEFLNKELGSIFHSPSYFQLHMKGRGHYFEWVKEQHVAACIHFTELEDGRWRSPARGTFSGYAFDANLSSESLFAFHEAVQEKLISHGSQSIEILLPPMAHDAVAFSKQCYLLRSQGYETSSCDLNYCLSVTEQSFPAHISYGNDKRLRKCQREGLIGEHLPLSALPEVYETLATNRASKGHLMSMTLEQLQAMIDVFPNAIVLFGVKHANQLAASALCIRISSEILYVFYWGDLPGYSSYSPVVTLANSIYNYCQTEGITLLDAGTSTEDRSPNHGLIQFKRGLGFTESLKVKMKKNL